MIIVTGASQGLGNNICLHLKSLGYQVLGLSRSVESKDFDYIKCDVTNYDDLKRTAAELKKKRIKVTGLINAAGIASMNLAVTTPPVVTKSIIETDLIGSIFTSQIFGSLMMREKFGNIINFSTIAVNIGLQGESVYAASKAGVESFSRIYAKEVAPFNITVNCIAPGPINTNLIKGVPSKNIDKIIAQQIIKKSFKAEDVSKIVEIILDEKMRSITGQVFNLGGY